MTTTARPAPAAAPTTSLRRPWLRVLAWSVLISAGVDVAVMALTGEVIPPVAIGAVLSFAGVALLGRFPRSAVAALAAVSTLLVAMGAPFVVPHLAHPESGVDFVHAVAHLGGRLVAIAAAAGAWRQASAQAAGWLARLAAGALCAAVVIGAVGVARTHTDVPAADDVTVVIRDFAFPVQVRVPSGDGIFAHNTDLVRHTFSVAGTDLSHQLPGRASLRFAVDLQPGTYRLFCAVAGHEAMKTDLLVE